MTSKKQTFGTCTYNDRVIAAKKQMSGTGDTVQSLSSLKSDHKNARKRTLQGKNLIEESLKRYGAARSIVIDESNRVLAGNGTIEAAVATGIDRVRIVETDGDEIIAVRRTGLTEESKVGLALADNRTSELAEWDKEMLSTLSSEHKIDPWFDDDTLLALLAEDEPDFDEGEVANDQLDKIEAVFQILINCRNEEEQTATLDYLLGQGLDCKAMNA